MILALSSPLRAGTMRYGKAACHHVGDAEVGTIADCESTVVGSSWVSVSTAADRNSATPIQPTATASGTCQGVDRVCTPVSPPAISRTAAGWPNTRVRNAAIPNRVHPMTKNALVVTAPASTDHPGDPLRISGSLGGDGRHHERLEPPVAGNEKGAEEGGQIPGQAEASQRHGFAGIEGSESEQQCSHPEQRDGICDCVRRSRP